MRLAQSGIRHDSSLNVSGIPAYTGYSQTGRKKKRFSRCIVYKLTHMYSRRTDRSTCENYGATWEEVFPLWNFTKLAISRLQYVLYCIAVKEREREKIVFRSYFLISRLYITRKMNILGQAYLVSNFPFNLVIEMHSGVR